MTLNLTLLGMTDEELDDFETILVCAERYALGRRTYMPGLVTDFIMNKVGKLLPRTVSVMLEDLRRVPPQARGDSCDIAVWGRFEEWLRKLKEEQSGD